MFKKTRNILPEFLKKIIRFIYYKNERSKVFREIKIRKQQNKLIQQQYDENTENLIVFIVDGASWFTGKDTISGGILSIASIYEESKKLKNIHNSEVIMLTQKDAHLLLKHTQFDNNITVFRFEQLFKYFKNLKNVIFHIPTILLSKIDKQFSEYEMILKSIKNIQINILNQNIMLMTDVQTVENVKIWTPNVSQTTAHIQYTNKNVREKYGIPLHYLSVFADSEKYDYRFFSEKENIILVSPDCNQHKNNILKNLKTQFPDFKFIVIKNIKYKNYRELITKAKYMITFGEGLDFYYLETVFSGGVSFAVYNKDFFTPAFENTHGIFANYNEMEINIGNKIKEFNCVDVYSNINKEQFDLCEDIYSFKKYTSNIENFYLKKYTFA